MRRIAWFAGAGVLLSLAVGVWTWVGPTRLVPRGRSAYERGDWAGAARIARERLKTAPDDREALRLLARASSRLQRDEATQKIYWRLGSEGAGAEDFFLLASAMLRQSQDGRAMVLLERAREMDPDHAETLHALAGLYTDKAFPTAATAVARRLASRPGWEARGHWALGSLLLRRHDAAGAAASFREALGRDPLALGIGSSPEAVRKLLARALLVDQKPGEARAALRPILDAGPDAEAFWLLGRAWLQEGKPGEALAATDRAGGYGKDAPTADEPAPFVGDAQCASCHAEIHHVQSSSRHSHTFARGGAAADLPLPDRPLADPRIPAISHVMRRESDEVRVEARLGDEQYAALVEYVLGSGHRGRTALVRDRQGLARESRLTHYARGIGWGLTVHHPDRPDRAWGLLGKPMIEDQVEDCLRCHVTDVRSARERSGPLADDRGIRCECCHGPGGNHLKAVALSFPDPAIGRARLDGPSQRNALCADCHRAPSGAPPEGRDFVRFQSPNLAQSRCFTRSDGALECTTCHDPHRDAATSPAFYEAICLDCHGRDGSSTAPAGVTALPDGRRRVPCPVNQAEGCVSCHMPSVPEAIPNASYTDHFIRVHRDHPR